MNMKRYKQIAHTADLGAEIYGRSLEELFANAAFAMFDMITADLEKVELRKEVEIEAEGVDAEDLLVTWLNELLYRSSSDEIVFSRFDIRELGDKGLKAAVRGGRPAKINTEIKAATYHDVKIERDGKGYKVTVVFDV
ncbi:MAG: protein archease [Candidatus Omnitrophica bacterium]|nr:protein archease [Candidatus Omnitrophota bacterium]